MTAVLLLALYALCQNRSMRKRWLQFASVALLGCDSGDDPCAEIVDHYFECYDDVGDLLECEDDAWRCREQCRVHLTCEEEYAYWDDHEVSREVQRCLLECALFRCDDGTEIAGGLRCSGNIDCLDGSDERNCEYLQCPDGPRQAWAQCDDDAGTEVVDAGR